METTNHEYYVSLEVAKLLKEAGFDWETFSHWTESDINNPDFKFSGLSDKPILYDGYTPIDEDACVGRKKDWNNYNNECPLLYNYSAPTLEVAQRWLREVKGIEITIDWSIIVDGKIVDFNERGYSYHVESEHFADGSMIKFKTYEEALDCAIRDSILFDAKTNKTTSEHDE